MIVQPVVIKVGTQYLIIHRSDNVVGVLLSNDKKAATKMSRPFAEMFLAENQDIMDSAIEECD